MRELRNLALLTTLVSSVGVVTSCAPEPPVRLDVEMSDLTFSPETLTMVVGDTVIWVNHDLVPHTISSNAAISSGAIVGGESFAFIPTAEGEVSYVCDYHPGMGGTLRVKPR